MKPEAEALRARAEFVGCLAPEPFHDCAFHEVEHYFDETMRELGYVTWPHSRLETTRLFEPPREWCPEFLTRLVRQRLHPT